LDFIDLIPYPALIIFLALAVGAVICAASLPRSSDLNFGTGVLLYALYVMGLLQTMRFSLDLGVSEKAEHLDWPVVLTGSSLMIISACSQLFFGPRHQR